jgi:Sortase domain
MDRFRYLSGVLLAGALLVGLGARPTTTAAPSVAPSAAALASAPILELPSSSASSATPTTPPAAPGRDIDGARIVIARLGIDLPLAWGDIARDVPHDGYAGATPERVALVFPGSALPGAGGNTYVYSHARTGMFLSLWNVRAGDVVALVWPDAELRYSIERVEPRVDPLDTTWLDARGPERLTLRTSTGPSASDPRFVAVAVPVRIAP